MADNKIIYADELQKAIVDDVTIKGRAFAAVMRHIQEAQGVYAVVLPCKPGDTVYELHNNTDACMDCRYRFVGFNDEWCENDDVKYSCYPTIAEIPLCEKQFMEIISYTPDEKYIVNHRECFGKTIFITHEEAEAALAKMDGGNEDG